MVSNTPQPASEEPIIVSGSKRNIFDSIPKNIVGFAGILLFLAIGIIIARQIQKPSTLLTKAGTNTVKITVQPSSVSMPPNTTLQVWATADNPVAGVTVKVVFNPTLIQLSGDVVTTMAPLTRTIKKTALAEANTTGIINLSLGLDPASRATPPTGTFQIAALPFTVRTSQQNLSALVHLDTASMQAVNPDASVFTIASVDSTLTLNPIATPTPTLLPTSAPNPTALPTATPAPTPIPSDTTSPSVSVISPTNGAIVFRNVKVTFAAAATDNIGVKKVIFLVNSKTICNDTTAPYSCQWRPSKKGTNMLTAKVYDAIGNEGVVSIAAIVQ